MGFDVSNKPLVVNLVYYGRQSNYVETTTPVQQFEPLDPALATALAPVAQYLTGHLGAVFDGLWDGVRVSQEAAAKTLFTKQALAAGQIVYSVNATFPSTGVLTVFLEPPEAAIFGNPAKPPRLDLEYVLSGCDIAFDTAGAAAWDVSFDATIVISIYVAVLPFTLTPSATISLSNANLSDDNFLAWFENTLSDFANFLTGGLVASASGSVQTGIDGVQQATGLLGLGGLISALNAAGPEVVAYGFTECAFSVENQDALTLTITHLLDPGPGLENSNDPVANHQLSNPPALSVSDSEVKPGQTITAFGANFPVETVNQLSVVWPNTSAGKAAGAQVQYEIVGQTSATPIDVPLPNGFSGLYGYTAAGLAPNTDYQFKARCGDVLTWSKWTDQWFKIKTAQTKLVNLVLKSVSDPGLASVVVGSADLSATSNQWQASAHIPAGTADGNYDLIAQLGGTQLAVTQIIVAQILTPILRVVDPTTHAVISQIILAGGSPFTVKGEGFPFGPVNLTLNGKPEGMAPAPNGEFVHGLTTPGDPNSNAEAVTIDATSGGLSASFTFTTTPPPK
jgi:hypothetical protein